MRLALLIFAAAVATPALAQPVPPLPPSTTSIQAEELWAQQQMARQQQIALQNQLMALEAQVRTEQSIAQVQAQRITPRLPLPDVGRGGPLPSIDTGALASIPDSALAASNKRVLDAAGNRR
jgi:hypothetical protein